MKSEDLEYAGFFVRLIAVIIDWFLLSLFFYNFFPFQGFHLPDFKNISFIDLKNSLLILDVYGLKGFFSYYSSILLGVFFPFLITFLFWVSFLATPGKMLFRMKIVDVSTGQTPKKIQFFIRYLGYFVSGIFLLGFWWIFFDAKKQGWHDKIARTVVIKQKKKQVMFQK